MLLILTIALAIVIYFAIKVMKKNESQRLADEALKKLEEEETLEEQQRLAEEAEHVRQEQSFCESLNKSCKTEFEAWEARFCTEENRGFRIAGINHQNLSDKYIGAFKGTVKAEDWNAFDPKAVAIYRGQKKVGYIPKEFSADVYSSLKNGKDVCYGCIYAWYDYDKDRGRLQHYAGKVIIGPLQDADA